MMTKRRLIGRALAGAALAIVAVCGTGAAAQQVDRIIAFGDSYADSGNFFALTGINPVSTIIYPTGRFTGGLNYVDYLGQIYSLPPQNFAIGGALTGNTNTTAGLPGFAYEYTAYLAGGGGVFPTVPKTFGPGDLVTLSIGGNDARVYQQTGGTVAGAPAAAAIAVTQSITGLNALVNAGAPTISFTAGNTALLPEIAGNTSAQAVRQAYSTAYAQGIQTALAGYAANGTIVHYLDLTTMLQQVQANPGAYGFTSVGLCAPIAQCVSDSSYANKFVFWVDALHPTSHTSQVIAQYIAAQLNAPLTFGATSDLALETGQQFGRTLTERMDLNPVRYGAASDGLKLFLVGDGYNRDIGATGSTDAFEVRDYGVSAGAEYGFGSGVVGIAANFSRPKATINRETGATRDRTWQVGGFAAADAGAAFVQGYLGYGHDDHRITRTGVVQGMTASPNGTHWLAGAKAGYLMPFGPVRLGPVVGLDYANAKVDAYTESGDPTLTLNVGSTSAKALEGSLGAELRGNLTAGGAAIRPLLAATLVKDFQGEGQTIFFDQTDAPTIVNHWAVEGRSKRAYGRLSTGLSAQITNAISVDGLASATVSRKNGNDVSAQVGLKVGF